MASDLAETIARVRAEVSRAHPDDNIPVSWRSLCTLLDAAEAKEPALLVRDAAEALSARVLNAAWDAALKEAEKKLAALKATLHNKYGVMAVNLCMGEIRALKGAA